MGQGDLEMPSIGLVVQNFTRQEVLPKRYQEDWWQGTADQLIGQFVAVLGQRGDAIYWRLHHTVGQRLHKQLISNSLQLLDRRIITYVINVLSAKPIMPYVPIVIDRESQEVIKLIGIHVIFNQLLMLLLRTVMVRGVQESQKLCHKRKRSLRW